MSASSAAVPAAITVLATESSITHALGDKAAMVACFAGSDHPDGSDIAFFFKRAPGERGTEIHATSHERNQEQLKAGLRRLRSLLEAGEISTGARR